MFYIIKSSDVTNGLVKLTDHLKGNYLLHSLSFTNNNLNVNEYNNILPYFEGSLTNIELTQQYVDGTDLASDIQTKIDAVSDGTVSVQYNSATCTFTITNTVNFSLSFADNTTNTCHQLLGFTQTNTGTGTTITSDLKADLVAFKHICINIIDSDCYNVVDQSYNSSTFIVQGRSDFGDKFEYTADNKTTRQLMRLTPTKTLKIKFYDENNNELSLTNWILILEKSLCCDID